MPSGWDLSCKNWGARILAGSSLIPALPLIAAEADLGVAIFDELRLPDVEGKPRLADACGPWFRDIVRAAFGSWDPVERHRYIRDIFLMAPKGSSKTSYGAGLMITSMLMNRRPRAEALFIGPTHAISERAYEQAVGMIEASPDLTRRFHPRDHIKTIEDRVTGGSMRLKTFDAEVLTGAMLIFVLLDELHLLGRTKGAAKVLRQIRGGLDKCAEGQLLITTTQSDDVPVGIYREELRFARAVRDDEFRGRTIRPTLPVLYEFPPEIASDPTAWQDPANWHLVMPNLGRSAHLSILAPDWEAEKTKGGHAIQLWASQHLNLEIGQAMRSDRWSGAEFWGRNADPSLTLDAVIERSEVIVVGIDGGGLDDLFGLCVLGRCKQTRNWLAWSHAWCHEGVLDRRKGIAEALLDFSNSGELSIVGDALADISEIVELIGDIHNRGLLASVAVDPAGIGEFVDALADAGIRQEDKRVTGAPQGYAMMNAIKTAERKLANGTLVHGGSGLMAWCVGNLKIEPTATAVRATKQFAGDAKIDAVMALFNAVTIMSITPAPRRSVYEERGILRA